MDVVTVSKGILPIWTRDGYGYGYGNGYGYSNSNGSGSGSGSGYGDGYGDGSGYGHGDGYGYSYSNGFGSGSGDGYGDGYGSGYGYGYDHGDGNGVGGSYWQAAISSYAARFSRAAEAIQHGATLAFWKSDKAGRPCNGGAGCAVKPGHIDVVAGPLVLCQNGVLHATLDPQKWKGDRTWLVALYGEVVRIDDKLGAIKREIIAEVTRLAENTKEGELVRE